MGLESRARLFAGLKASDSVLGFKVFIVIIVRIGLKVIIVIVVMIFITGLGAPAKRKLLGMMAHIAFRGPQKSSHNGFRVSKNYRPSFSESHIYENSPL